jgi:hypothetical protein
MMACQKEQWWLLAVCWENPLHVAQKHVAQKFKEKKEHMAM